MGKAGMGAGKPRIRVRYSGLLIFAGQAVSLLLGFVFSVFIARSLEKEVLGAWFLVMGFVSYFQAAQRVFPFWARREAARGREVAKTLLAANSLLSLAAWAAFLGASPLFADAVGDAGALYVASLFIVAHHAAAAFDSVIGARAPHRLAPRNPLIDIAKLALIFPLIGFGLVGVLLAVLLAQLLYLLYAFRASKPFLTERVDWSRVRRWLGLGWLPLYSYAGGAVYTASDKVLVGLIASPEALASYGVALTIAGTLKLTGFLPSALAPKILAAGTDPKDVANAHKLTLMFLIPLYVGGMLAAPNLITIFGSKYLDGLPALYLLLTAYFVGSFGGYVALNVITASDRVDAGEAVTPKALVGSKLFKVYSLTYPSAAILIASTILLVPTLGILGAALAVLAVSIFGVIAGVLLAPEVWRLLPVKSIASYGAASAPMAAFLSLTPYSGSLQTLTVIGVSAIIYFAALMATSGESRTLVRLILSEIKSRLSP